MAGSSIKLGVDVTEFKRGMTEAQASVKTLDAAIKTNEKSMQAYGKSENYVSTQASLLNSKLKEQEKIVQNAEKSLKAMEENGVSKSSKSYQDMQRRMIEARGAMLDTTMQLNQLTTGEADAAKGADKLGNSIGGISKKISLDQVIRGIDKITGGLENAAKKAISFGQALWENITEGANWADNTATGAAILGMDIEDYQRYTKVFDTVADITVKDWQNAKNKVQKAVVNTTDEQFDIFAALGVGLRNVDGTINPRYNRYVIGTARDWEDVFWDVGAKLRENVKNGKLTQDQADVYAQAIFGKSWGNLNPIFEKGREAFEQELKDQTVVTEESVNKLAELNDTLVDLQGDFASLKNEVLAGLAPALQEGAKALDGVLSSIMEYLKTDAGQEMLERLGNAVSGLFEDLGKIDPEKVVSGFVSVFNTITDGLKWLLENKDALQDVLVGIVTAWAGAELTGGALQVLQLVNGVKYLTGAGGGEDGTTTTTGGGSTTGGGGFWTNVINKAALVGSAASVYRATEGNMKQQLADFYSNYGGLSIEEQAKLMWMQTTGMSEAEYNYRMGSDGGGAFFGTPEEPVEVTVAPVAEDGSAQSITDQVGTVDINGIVHITGVDGDILGVSGNWWGGDGSIVRPHRVGSNANGIWAVPYDGYLTRLHKNEQVLPAREVSSRNFSSNLYVESMIMNNGTDAAGLAASMAAAQRRTMAGFGN